jgi:hypothetical protein
MIGIFCRNVISKMNAKKLSGEADENQFKSVDSTGDIVNPNKAIFPIIAQDIETNVFRLVGTGFFIHPEGLIITAKHVLQDVMDRKGNVIGPIGIFCFHGHSSYYIRRIIRAHYYPNSDVAVALLDQPRHNTTKETLKGSSLALSFSQRKENEYVFTYAYPKSEIESNGLKHKMIFVPAFYEGKLIQEFPNGRDSATLPNPCWQTDIHLHGGSSGGPVFDAKGYVIGVNSTSFSGDPSLSFISTIYHIINLKITQISIEGRKEADYTLKELIRLNLIRARDY